MFLKLVSVQALRHVDEYRLLKIPFLCACLDSHVRSANIERGNSAVFQVV